MPQRLTTIDSHAGGAPVRLVVGGFPSPRGRTMREKRDWLRKRHDRLRRALVHEPRGHPELLGAVLTEPVSADAHAGLLFMNGAGYVDLSGHGVIAAITVAVERQLMTVPEGVTAIGLDTLAGTVLAQPILREGRVGGVAMVNVPAFVLAARVPVAVGGRVIQVDVAYGGRFFAIVDGEAAGVPIRGASGDTLRVLGQTIVNAVDAAVTVEHPLEPRCQGVHGTIFTGLPDREDAHLRSVVVTADGRLGRAPSGTGTSAVMAVLDAMGLLGEAQQFVHEGILGTRVSGSLQTHTAVGELSAIVTRIEGSAWITGAHEFVLEEDDPFKHGYVL